jgi:hypothetical protein
VSTLVLEVSLRGFLSENSMGFTLRIFYGTPAVTTSVCGASVWGSQEDLVCRVLCITLWHFSDGASQCLAPSAVFFSQYLPHPKRLAPDLLWVFVGGENPRTPAEQGSSRQPLPPWGHACDWLGAAGIPVLIAGRRGLIGQSPSSESTGGT